MEQHVAMRTFVVSELRHGRLPLWDPYTFAGEPAVADSLFSTFYPLSFWQVLLPEHLLFRELEFEAVFHLGLAGVFTFLLVQHLTGSTAAGFISGLAFGLGGFLTSYPMLQIIILQSAIWLPAGLWLLERAFAQRSLRYVALAGAVFGWAVLAGHPQTFLYIAYLTGAYLLFRASQLNLGYRFSLATASLLVGITLGISAAQWLPSLQMARFSPRASLGYEDVSHGFSLTELVGLVRPNAGEWSPLYIGAVPLLLVLLAIALSRRREVYFWALVALIALLISLGRNGFLYPIAYRILPGFAVFRDQERAAFLVSFALAVLAGYGYAVSATRLKWPGWTPALLGLLLFLDLFHANSGAILEAAPNGSDFARTPLVQHLQQVSEPTWRVSSEGLLPGGANAGLVFHLRDVVGSGPLYLEALDRFVKLVPEMRWWQMLNVKHVVTKRELAHGALLPVMKEGDKRLYQIFLDSRPAWIVHNFEVAPDQNAAIQRTSNPAFDPFETVVLEAPPDLHPGAATAPEAVRVLSFEHQRIVMEATLSAPGILVTSEVFYPGWVAIVDGKRVSPMRAYGFLRAVPLSAGRWRIEWRFEPLLARLGLIISGLTALWVGLFWASGRRLR